MEKQQGRKIRFCGILLCLLAVVMAIVIHAAKRQEEGAREILYENTEYGIGFWMPRGYTENPFQIFSTETEGEGLMVAFFAPEADMQIFSLWYLNRAYWENEVKENFSGIYEEIYADEERVLLCISVTDVQYDPADKEKKKEYRKLLGLQDEICDSFYTFAIPEQGGTGEGDAAV